MAIAITLQKYLADHNVEYDTVTHRPTQSSNETAYASQISGDRIAKAVVLNTGDGYVLAVLPASHHLQLRELKPHLNGPLGLVTEPEIAKLFADCEVGAVPALGKAYGLDVIVDATLRDQPEVYFEAGDHATLVHLSGREFDKVLGDTPQIEFSTHD